MILENGKNEEWFRKSIGAWYFCFLNFLIKSHIEVLLQMF
jgi:hypothetical protein